MAPAARPQKKSSRKTRRTLLHVKSPAKLYTVQSLGKEGAPISGVITDIDRLEMGLFAYGRIAVDTPVMVEIGGKMPGKLQAIVTHCKPLPLSSHIVRAETNPPLWRIRIRAIVGGKEEAEFPQELVDALMKEGG